MSFDTSPWDASGWWLVVFTATELAAGEARFGFPKDKATGGAIVRSKGMPFEIIRERWDIKDEHMHAYELENRQANEIVKVDHLIDAEHAVLCWNRFATDTKEKKKETKR